MAPYVQGSPRIAAALYDRSDSSGERTRFNRGMGTVGRIGDLFPTVERAIRVTWTLVSIFVVECLVFGLAMLPGALFWEVFSLQTYPYFFVRIIVLSMAFVPAYGLFAVSLMVLSALSTRWLGWRTPANGEMPIKALEWPLLHWVRYMVSVHIVRLFAGSVFRATPLWTFYLRLNGARLGRGVYVNSLR